MVIFSRIFLRDTTASWKQKLSLCSGSVVCSLCNRNIWPYNFSFDLLTSPLPPPHPHLHCCSVRIDAYQILRCCASLLLYYFTKVSALVQFRMDKFFIGGDAKIQPESADITSATVVDIQNQTNGLQRNCVQLESDLTLTVSTAPPRITSINLLLKVTQVKSASLLLHVTESTSVYLLSQVTQVQA
jgi:hypothetical protein